MTVSTFEDSTYDVRGSRFRYVQYEDLELGRGFDSSKVFGEYAERHQHLVQFGYSFTLDPLFAVNVDEKLLHEQVLRVVSKLTERGIPISARIEVDDDPSPRRPGIIVKASSISIMYALVELRDEYAEQQYERELDHGLHPLDTLAAIPGRIGRIAAVRAADLNYDMTGDQCDFDLFTKAVANLRHEEVALAANDSRYRPAPIPWDAVHFEPLAARATQDILGRVQ